VLIDPNNAITSHKRYLWADGHQPAEERAANGTTIERRYHHQGEQRNGGTDAGFYYYSRSHLGSIREVTGATGTIRALYDYDPYGKREKLSGDLDTEISFTGHPYHAGSGLHLTLFRAYDAELGRWLSADPLGEAGGLNLYRYVFNDPINGWDPYGLEFWSWSGTAGDWAENAAEFSMGMADKLSFGVNAKAREAIYGDDYSDPCSKAYKGGEWAGTAVGLAAGGGGVQLLRGGRALNLVGGQSRQGIYVFRDAYRGGRQYVGQSTNIGNRLNQHGSRVGGHVRTYTVRGNRRALDSAEQQMIERLGGVSNLANRRNQIGAARKASGYYNPRMSADAATGIGGAAGAATGALNKNCN
jgi:RHS repeat-associated protein